MIYPKLEKEFAPAILEIRKYNELVSKYEDKVHVVIAIERNGGYIYRKEIDTLPEGVNDEYNNFIIERLIKTILWVVGGYKIFIAGSNSIYKKIKEYYSKDGLRAFDFDFMSTVYEKEVEVVECSYDNIPEEKSINVQVGGHLKGRRIGFDAGGSDRKMSACIDGEVIYSEEVVWNPKTISDSSYHFDGIYQAFKTGIEKLGGDVDAIGVSSAGVYIDDKAMVSSLFIKCPDKVKCQTMYLDVNRKIEEELGHKVPISVCNDGDVTALAGAMDLNDGRVLGIAMGTSEAVGYVNKEGLLNGWLSELAFVPVDFNKDSEVDEWSHDFGVGCKYFSQDAVIKLAPRAGIEFPQGLTLAEKLKYVQKLMEDGDERPIAIFESIGVYLAYAIAYYSMFYDIKHLIILGRVTSGKGGDLILSVCKETLEKEFPEYKDINLTMPSEKMRRVGQSIAAASLAE